MIRYFSVLFKSIRNHSSDVQLFSSLMDSFCPHTACCPSCHAKGSLSFLCRYERSLISWNGSVCCSTISIDRCLCSYCGHTHAILPDLLIPFGSYSIFFILTVLRQYFSRQLSGQSISQLCARFQISPSTLYAWKKLFLSHKSLFLGALLDLSITSEAFLKRLLHEPEILEVFFLLFGFSFLQAASCSKFP